MNCPTIANRPKTLPVLLLATALAAVLLALVGTTRPAEAAFPGSNGAIAFESQANIYRMDSDGFVQTKLSDSPQYNQQPVWSADGNKIALTNFNNNFEIYWMDSDGSGETNLTQAPVFNDSEPALFPDYHTIAFTSNRNGGDNDIFKMTVNDAGTITDGPTQLTTSLDDDSEPAVSPDGKKIAFVSDRDGLRDIYVIKASAPESSTNKPVKLTKSVAFDGSPDWSPGGAKIVFHSNRSGSSEIVKMRADGSSQVNLTNNVGVDGNASWQPDP